MINWKCVYTTDRLDKTEAIQGLLAEENIEAVVMNKTDSAYLIGDVELYVKSEDVNKAVELIKGFKIE
jgi:type III secretory pathway lipoprotein EscJ